LSGSDKFVKQRKHVKHYNIKILYYKNLPAERKQKIYKVFNNRTFLETVYLRICITLKQQIVEP